MAFVFVLRNIPLFPIIICCDFLAHLFHVGLFIFLACLPVPLFTLHLFISRNLGAPHLVYPYLSPKPRSPVGLVAISALYALSSCINRSLSWFFGFLTVVLRTTYIFWPP